MIVHQNFKYMRFLIFLFLPSLLCGQDSIARSNADLFAARAGRLVHKTFFLIGTVHKVQVEAVRLVDLLSRDTSLAVRLESNFAGQYTVSNYAVVLDLDEVVLLIRGLLLLEETYFAQQPVNYTEVNFASRSDFTAGAYYDYKTKAWQAFISLSKIRDYKVLLNKQEFQSFRFLLEEARNKLIIK